MELEDLKLGLEKKSVLISAQHAVAAADRFPLHLRSQSIMQKVLGSIRVEIAFSLAFGLGALILLFSSSSVAIAIFLGAISLYSLSFAYYLQRLHARVNKHILSLQPIKDSLYATVQILEHFIKLYRRLTTWFIPCIFIAALFAGLIDFIQSEAALRIPYFSLAISLPIILVWVIFVSRFTRWYLNRLYGDYLSQMRAHVKELETE